MKPLPHNPDMEMALLATLLLNNRSFDDLCDLSHTDFYIKKHQTIYRAMGDLRAKGETVDLLTIADHMGRNGDLEQIGGASYLSKLADNTPMALNPGGHARTIKDLSTIRDAVLTCMRIIDGAYTTQDPEDFLSDAQASILALKTSDAKDRFYSMETLAHEALNRIEKAQSDRGERGYSFGLPVLDNAIRITGSKLIIVAARPGMGKTALALSIAKHLAKNGTKTAILSIEMDRDSLTDRFLSEESDVNNLCFYAKDSLSAEAKMYIKDAAENLSKVPIYVDDSECNIQDVERKCRLAKKMGCEVIFIDQLSKIQYPANLTEFQGYTRNCNRIALLKKELRMPIVLLCQLNRELEKRGDKNPVLSDLKQTGAIEEDADMVFFIYRPGYYGSDESAEAQAETYITLAKNRNGATGVEDGVVFKAKRGMFQMGGRK
jgi:replicative DNA helicase